MTVTLHLVDASPYIFRAFHSLPSGLRDPEGRQVNAIYGFAGFLLRLIETERPSHVAMCFDGSLTTSFRNEIYAPYKAHREPPPVELEAQVEECREVAEILGMATLSDRSFEADDLIASLVAATASWANRMVVVSSDKDLAQLVSEQVELLDFAKQNRLGPDEVVAKLGVRASQVPDLLGLAGDSVDNIPGVKGVGMKTAVRLLQAFESVEDIVSNLEQVSRLAIRGAASVAARIEADRERALLSKRLATVSIEAPVPGTPDRLAISPVDEPGLEAFCSRLGFVRLPDRVRRVMVAS